MFSFPKLKIVQIVTVRVCGTMNFLHCSCFLASSGSDSPDQALEAEEIVRQLDIEQVVETHTSTVTSTQELCSGTNFYSSVTHLPSLRPPHMLEASPTTEEGELDADADLPPLTGRHHSSEKLVLIHQGFCW